MQRDTRPARQKFVSKPNIRHFATKTISPAVTEYCEFAGSGAMSRHNGVSMPRLFPEMQGLTKLCRYEGQNSVGRLQSHNYFIGRLMIVCDSRVRSRLHFT